MTAVYENSPHIQNNGCPKTIVYHSLFRLSFKSFFYLVYRFKLCLIVQVFNIALGQPCLAFSCSLCLCVVVICFARHPNSPLLKFIVMSFRVSTFCKNMTFSKRIEGHFNCHFTLMFQQEIHRKQLPPTALIQKLKTLLLL